MEYNEKMKIVIVGHVDHGKSTLIGRLLYDTNSIARDKIEELENLSKKSGKSIEFAHFLDHFQEEREQGITIDTTQTFFKTAMRQYVIIDAPGHAEFIKNMVTGAAQAEAAILIVDANEGIREQTKRHAFILSLLGMEQIILAVNKMDLARYSKQVFDGILKNMEGFLETVNLSIKYAIPISAIDGDNVAFKSKSFCWYEGKTVLEALDSFGRKQADNGDYPVFPVQDIYKTGSRRIAVGRLETGRIKVDDEVLILPSMQKTRIKSIEKFSEDVKESKAGECIGITTRDPVFLERGSVVCAPGGKVSVSDRFRAGIFWMSRESLKVGERVILRCATQEMPCVVDEIHKKIDSSTLEEIDDDYKALKTLEACQVSIKTKRPVAVSLFNELWPLGRFVMVKDNNISGGGIITSV